MPHQAVAPEAMEFVEGAVHRHALVRTDPAIAAKELAGTVDGAASQPETGEQAVPLSGVRWLLMDRRANVRGRSDGIMAVAPRLHATVRLFPKAEAPPDIRNTGVQRGRRTEDVLTG